VRKSLSLKGKTCFGEVYRKGKRFRVKGFQCAVIRHCAASENPFCCDRSGNSPQKFGIIINRRFGNACERNKAKRRVRAIIDSLSSDFAGSWCMTIRIFDEYKETPFLEGAESFKYMCRKVGIIREKNENSGNNN
jgi:ribonuclease P protein component